MSTISDHIQSHFPALADAKMMEAIEAHGFIREVKSGSVIIKAGDYIREMPLVTKGAIKVIREDESGAEVFLYFLFPGQSCAMTLQCCTMNSPSHIRAVAEEDTEFISIPIDKINSWLTEFPSWKNFILATYSDRFNELLSTIDSVAFDQLDSRLFQYLQEKSSISGTNKLQITHQSIAEDLNSSREVISRLLKQFEKAGKLKLGRNNIELV